MPLTRRPHQRLAARLYRYGDHDPTLFLRIDGWSDDGRVRVSTHKVDLPVGTSVPQAMVERDRLMAEVHAGTYVREAPARSVMTVGDVTEAWFRSHADNRASSLITMQSWSRLWLDEFAELPVPALTYQRLVTWYDDIVDAYSASYARRIRTALSSVLQVAVELGQIERDPTALLPKVRNRKDPVILPSLERVERALAYWHDVGVEKPHMSGVGTLLWLVEYGALRPGEACRLRWSDLDLDAGSLHIPEARSKTHRARTVPLGASAVETLRRHQRDARTRGTPAQDRQMRDPEGFVFPGARGAAYTPSRIVAHDVWLTGCKVAGLQSGREHGWTPHKLRYCGISRMLRAGMSERMIRLIAGHDVRASHVQYARVFADELADVGELLDAARVPRSRANHAERGYSERVHSGYNDDDAPTDDEVNS